MGQAHGAIYAGPSFKTVLGEFQWQRMSFIQKARGGFFSQRTGILQSPVAYSSSNPQQSYWNKSPMQKLPNMSRTKPQTRNPVWLKLIPQNPTLLLMWALLCWLGAKLYPQLHRVNQDSSRTEGTTLELHYHCQGKILFDVTLIFLSFTQFTCQLINSL